MIDFKKLEDDLVILEDGAVKFWPCGKGYFTAYELRIIADEIDRRNNERQLSHFVNERENMYEDATI